LTNIPELAQLHPKLDERDGDIVTESKKNMLSEIRKAQMLSKAELARKAGVSPLTIARIEVGKPCRMDTKRKIILALGLNLADRAKVFGDED
jgi:DNA-binding XRE family transcriptional regulator